MDRMAVFSAAIYLTCLFAIPWGAEAVSLRAPVPPVPDRSEAAAPSSSASPANVEEEEDLLDDGFADQAVAVSFPVTQPQPPQVQALAVQQMLQGIPSQSSGYTPQPLAAVPTSEMPTRPEQVAAAAPELPLRVPEAPMSLPGLPPMPAPPGPIGTVPLSQLSSKSESASPQEALFQFTPPRKPNPLPPVAAVPKVNHLGKVPMFIEKRRKQEATMPANWPPTDNSYTTCNPPCLAGRGICNDRVCFCRSPFTGSTCQHKISALYRASRVMVVGFAAVCVMAGILVAKLVMTFAVAGVEQRMKVFGEGKTRFEVWCPPDAHQGKNKAEAKKHDGGA